MENKFVPLQNVLPAHQPCIWNTRTPSFYARERTQAKCNYKAPIFIYTIYIPFNWIIFRLSYI